MVRILRWLGYGGLIVAVLLIPASAHPDTQLSFSTPLHWAAANGQARLAELLISKGAFTREEFETRLEILRAKVIARKRTAARAR